MRLILLLLFFCSVIGCSEPIPTDKGRSFRDTTALTLSWPMDSLEIMMQGPMTVERWTHPDSIQVTAIFVGEAFGTIDTFRYLYTVLDNRLSIYISEASKRERRGGAIIDTESGLPFILQHVETNVIASPDIHVSKVK